MAVKRVLLGIAVITLCASCVPMAGTYLRPEYEGATHKPHSCGTAPHMTAFALDAISIEIGLDVPNPRVDGVWLFLRVPKGVTAQLVDGFIYVTLEGRDGKKYRKPLLLIPNSSPLLALLDGDTYTYKNLWGNRLAHRSYNFKAPIDLTNVDSGQVKLPDILVNGKPVPGPVVPFRRASFATIMPLNGC